MLIKYYKEDTEILYKDNLKYYCFPIPTDIMVDDKEQVFITRIKANLQCPIYHVFLKKRKNFIKS